ncbi:transcriptional regulator, AraC family [[Eubacterium] yurii subsp. margaretiae ATCC 43715]|nr:transcriptional regulator, AraC family [[Eubacterium] yurii subsp. margaretiae ATCC 43715]
MNFLMSFNMAMDYLETVLDQEVDEREILKITGYSYPMFSRIFSIFTDFTLYEYIRLRRLTKAGMEISESNIKIIDIALKYGYDSPNSFTSAFKKFHNTSPVNVRKGAPIKVFSKLRLSLSIQGGEKMNARIEVKKAFKVAGVKKKI